jgi:hypothetical protein
MVSSISEPAEHFSNLSLTAEKIPHKISISPSLLDYMEEEGIFATYISSAISKDLRRRFGISELKCFSYPFANPTD